MGTEITLIVLGSLVLLCLAIFGLGQMNQADSIAKSGIRSAVTQTLETYRGWPKIVRLTCCTGPGNAVYKLVDEDGTPIAEWDNRPAPSEIQMTLVANFQGFAAMDAMFG